MSQNQLENVIPFPFNPLNANIFDANWIEDWNRICDIATVDRITMTQLVAQKESGCYFDTEEDVKVFLKSKLLRNIPVEKQDEAVLSAFRLMHQGGVMFPVTTPASSYFERVTSSDLLMPKADQKGQEQAVIIESTISGFSVKQKVTQFSLSYVSMESENLEKEIRGDNSPLYEATATLNLNFNKPSTPLLTLSSSSIRCYSPQILSLLSPPTVDNVSDRINNMLKALGAYISRFDEYLRKYSESPILVTYYSELREKSLAAKAAIAEAIVIAEAKKPSDKAVFLLESNIVPILDKTMDFLNNPTDVNRTALQESAKTCLGSKLSPWRRNLGYALMALAAVVVVAAIVATIVLTAGVAAPVIAGGLGALAASVSVGGVTATTGAVIGTAAGVGVGLGLGGLFSKYKADLPRDLSKASEDLASVVKPS